MLHIVCPVFNEEENIGPLWKELTEAISIPFVIAFIYDHDNDTSLPPIQKLMTSYPNIVLQKNHSRGVLGALKTGFQQTSSGCPLLVIMADLSDDLAIVPQMVEAWESGASVVVASRYMPGGRQIGGGIMKATLSKLAGKSLYWFKKLPVRDATNNFRLYDSDFLKTQTIESEGGFELALELTAKAHKKGLKIREIPATWRDRSHGESKFKLLKWLPHYLKWYLFAWSK